MSVKADADVSHMEKYSVAAISQEAEILDCSP